MDFLQQAAVLLFTLALLIAFHEYGHFIVARLCGVKVLRFSLGFGPILLRRYDKKGTEFALAAIPLGGYVKMLDERETTVADEERHLAFNNKSVSQRIAIVSAGPIANFILAIFVYWLVFLQGSTALIPQVFHVENASIAAQAGLQEGLLITAVDGKATRTANEVSQALTQRIGETGEIILQARAAQNDVSQSYHLAIERWLSDATDQVDILGSLGFAFYQPVIVPIVDEVLANSAAAQAGLMRGDEILQVDGQKVKNWQDFTETVRAHAEIPLRLLILRDGLQHSLTLTPQAQMQDGKTIGLAGIRVRYPELPQQLLIETHYSVLGAFVPALEKTWNMTVFNLRALQKMLVGDLSYKQLSGPISIAKVVNQSTYYGLISYLSLLALLSISLGVLNLLPIPVLDGGHILFYSIEALIRRPVPEKIQAYAYQAGLMVVLFIMVLAIFNDISRL